MEKILSVHRLENDETKIGQVLWELAQKMTQTGKRASEADIN